MKTRKLTRRELFAAMAAGAVVTAAGLWMPGQKTISIPSGKVFKRPMVTISGNGTTIEIPVPDKGFMTVQELYSAIQDKMDDFRMMSFPNPVECPSIHLINAVPIAYITDGYKLDNEGLPYLRKGTIYERETGGWYSEVVEHMADPVLDVMKRRATPATRANIQAAGSKGLTHRGWLRSEIDFEYSQIAYRTDALTDFEDLS